MILEAYAGDLQTYLCSPQATFDRLQAFLSKPKADLT